MLEAVREHIRGEVAELCGSGRAPGYVAGVWHAGEQTAVAGGLANIATGAPMTEDTGFLAGSITKVMTVTLVLRCLERGELGLDERVSAYLPELTLAPPAKVENLCVRHLLNHTNGIDGDLFWPDQVKGRDALRYYVHELRRCSTLFDPGAYVSYSNAGMLVAGRALEVVTGCAYHELLEREIFAPVGMSQSCTSPEQAILRRTAVGHFFDPQMQTLQRTNMFMLPESWSACGATPIVTVTDLLGFARMHLGDGRAPTGACVLSAEHARQMRTVTVDMGSPNVSPMGLGWPLASFGQTTVLFHSGASPGGIAVLLLVPDHDFAFAAFGNASAAGQLHDRLAQWVLQEHLGLEGPPPIVWTPGKRVDLTAYAGTYRSDQLRVDVKVMGEQLEETITFEPLDEAHAHILEGFSGSLAPLPPRRLVPVRDRLFASAGVSPEAINGFVGRRMLTSFHGDEGGRPGYRSFGGRLTRRTAG